MSQSKEIVLRLTGFVIALILTMGAYFIILYPEMVGENVQSALTVIFALALLQSLVQLLFFIDVWEKKGRLWNLGVFISTISIIFIIIYFSIWIINHLNANMHL
jgi:cytochrome o ubiquinol oxidase operon protein cyoD